MAGKGESQVILQSLPRSFYLWDMDNRRSDWFMRLWCALQEFPWRFWRAATRWKAVCATLWGSARSDVLQLLERCAKPRTNKIK